MMFSPDLFPGGINYLYPGLTPERSSRTAAHLSRREVYIRYYLIDFGLSWAFKNVASRRPMCTGFGRYKDAPELSDTVPYDGFALDMWCIGKLIKEEIFEVRARGPCSLSASDHLSCSVMTRQSSYTNMLQRSCLRTRRIDRPLTKPWQTSTSACSRCQRSIYNGVCLTRPGTLDRYDAC